MPSFTSSPDENATPWAPFAHLAGSLAGTAGLIGAGVLAGVAGAMALRRRGLRWTWALAALLPAYALWSRVGGHTIVLPAAALTAARLGSRWRRSDVEAGG